MLPDPTHRRRRARAAGRGAPGSSAGGRRGRRPGGRRLGPRAGLAPALRPAAGHRRAASARRPPGRRWRASSSCRAPTSWRRRPSPGTSSTTLRQPVVVVGAMRNAGEADYDGARNLADAVRGGGRPAPARTGRAGRHGRARAAGRRCDEDAQPGARRVPGPQRRAAGADRGRPTGAGARARHATTDRDPARAGGRAHRPPDGGGVHGRRPAARGRAGRGAPASSWRRPAPATPTPTCWPQRARPWRPASRWCWRRRCAAGGVAPVYGFPGGGRSWQAAGAMLAGTLSGPKARVALALGLGAGLDRRGPGRACWPVDGHA